jgi:molecular chaperone DnaK (HSP70)
MRSASSVIQLAMLHARGARLLAALVLAGCASAPGTVEVGVDKPPLGSGMLLSDDVGLVVASGDFAPILAHGCELPCKGAFEMHTTSDDQTRMTLQLLRRISHAPYSVSRVAEFQIIDVPTGPAGTRNVEVTLRAKKDSISIHAVELSTDTNLTIRTVLFAGD